MNKKDIVAPEKHNMQRQASEAVQMKLPPGRWDPHVLQKRLPAAHVKAVSNVPWLPALPQTASALV